MNIKAFLTELAITIIIPFLMGVALGLAIVGAMRLAGISL